MQKHELIEQLASDFSELKRGLFRTVTGKIEPTVPQAQSELLFIVARHNSTSIGDLARELRITSSACTQLVDALIAHNLLVRKHDEHDRRIVNVSLSGHGSHQIDDLKREYMNGFIGIMDNLTLADLNELHRILKKINTSIEGVGIYE